MRPVGRKEPRKAKPFIDKRSAESFMVVHRSQLDPKFYDDDASKFVLMSTKATAFTGAPDGGTVAGDDGGGGGVSVASGQTGGSRFPLQFAERGYGGARARKAGAAGSVRSRGSSVRVNQLKVVAPWSAEASGGAAAGSVTGGGSVRRGIREFSEVDEFGFPVSAGGGADYDYGRHMAAMGGGTYISAASSRASQGVALTHSIAAALDIPDDVLPCAPDEQLERMLEAISADPAKLPPEIREAMDAIEELDEDAEGEECGGGGEGGDEGGDGESSYGGDGADGGEWVFEGGEEEEGAEGGRGGDRAPAAAASAGSAAPPRPAPVTRRAAAPSSSSTASVASSSVVVTGRGYEALNDDFVLMASGEVDIVKGTASDLPEGAPEEQQLGGGGGGALAGRGLPPGFDFEAHIARLMAAAEGKMTNTEDDFDEDGEGEEGDEFDGDDNGLGDDGMDDEDGVGGRAAAAAGAAATAAASRLDAGMLEAMLAQYANDEIGELYDDDPRLKAAGFGAIPAIRADVEEYDEEEEGDEEGGEGGDEDGAEGDSETEGDEGGAASGVGALPTLAGKQPARAQPSSGASVARSMRSGAGGAASVRSSSSLAAVPNAYAEQVISAAMQAYLRQREDEEAEASLIGLKGQIKSRNPGRGSGKTRAIKEAELQEALALKAAAEASAAEAAAAAGTVAARAAPSTEPAQGAAAGLAAASEPALVDSSAPSLAAPPAPSAAPARSGAGFAVKIGLRKPISFAPAPAAAAAASPAASMPALSSSATAAAAEVDALATGVAALGVSGGSASPPVVAPASVPAAVAAAGPRGPVPFGCAEGDLSLDPLDYFPPEWKNSRGGGAGGEDRHDAGTIVSTYTNTENRPRKLGGEDDRMTLLSGGLGGGAGHRARVLAGLAAGPASASASSQAAGGARDEDAASVAAHSHRSGGGGGNPGSAALFTGLGYGPLVIRLSKKTGLPVAARAAPIPEGSGGGEDGEEGAEDEEGDEEEDEEDEEDEDEDGAGGPGALLPPELLQRRRDETPDEKRARKAAVKGARRATREGKKALRLAFRDEELRQTAVAVAKAEQLVGRVRAL